MGNLQIAHKYGGSTFADSMLMLMNWFRHHQSIQEQLDKYCLGLNQALELAGSGPCRPPSSSWGHARQQARSKYLASELPNHLQALRSHQNLLKAELHKSNKKYLVPVFL